MSILYWTLGVATVLVGVWGGYTKIAEGGLEEPAYTVIESLTEGEIRQYEPFIVAQTEPSAPGDPGLREGFRVLAGYIFGGNSPNESMPMTAPVLQQNKAGESLPMTAPVLSHATDMSMAFVMPGNRTLDDLPKPDSDKVTLSQVDMGRVAAIGFSGRGKQARFKKMEATLRAELSARGIQTTAPALYAQYNSPYAFPLLRRNEVLISLSAPEQ